MAGRKKKHSSAVEGHRTQEEMDQRLESEEVLEQFEPIKKAPAKHLSAAAKKEYKRLVKQLELLHISDLDRGMLEMYCTWYDIFLMATNEASQVVIEEEGSKGQTISKRNPAIDILNMATNQMKSISSSMGMTLDSRLKLVNPPEGEQENDPFANF